MKRITSSLLLGSSLLVGGVMLAILWGKRSDKLLRV